MTLIYDYVCLTSYYMWMCYRKLRAPRPCATSAWLRCAAAWTICAAGEQTAP